MSDPDEWVTVAEGARRLGIDQKQVRRYAARLADTDRTPANVSPLSVRLSAIVSAREAGNAADRRGSAPDQPTDTDRTLKGQSTDSQQDMSAAGLVEQLRAENAFLRSELTATREGREVAEAELRRLLLVDREELRRLRAQLAITEAPQTVQGEGAANVDSSGPLQQAAAADPRHWWQFWRRK